MNLSLEGWPDGHVAPTTHTIQVIAGPPPPGPSEPVSQRLVRSLGHPDSEATILDVRFTADARLFAAGYPSGVIQILDIGTGRELRRIESPAGARRFVDYANPTADFTKLFVHVDRPKSISFEQDGKRQRRMTFQGELLAWDVTTGQSLPSIYPSVPDRGLMRACVAPTGDQAVLVEVIPHIENDGSNPPVEVQLVDLVSGHSKKLADGFTSAVFTPDGQRVGVAVFSWNGRPGRLFVLHLATGKTLWEFRSSDNGRGYSWPALSSNGQRLAVQDFVGSFDQSATLRVFDMETGKELAAFPSRGDYPFLQRPALSPDGSLLAATDIKGCLMVWDLATKKVKRTHFFGETHLRHGLAFAPDGKTLAVAIMPKSQNPAGSDPDPRDLPQPRIYLFDLASEADPELLMCPHGYPGGLAFSPDGQTLAFGSSRAVHLFDVRTAAKR